MERILLYNPRLRDSDELSINITTNIVLWKLGLSWWLDESTRNGQVPQSSLLFMKIKFY